MFHRNDFWHNVRNDKLYPTKTKEKLGVLQRMTVKKTSICMSVSHIFKKQCIWNKKRPMKSKNTSFSSYNWKHLEKALCLLKMHIYGLILHGECNYTFSSHFSYFSFNKWLISYYWDKWSKNNSISRYAHTSAFQGVLLKY